MSKLSPEEEIRVSLRATTELSGRPLERPEPAAPEPAPDAGAAADGPLEGLDALSLAAAGAAVVVGAGWLLQRRQRLVLPADAAPSHDGADFGDEGEVPVRRSRPRWVQRKRLLMKFFLALRSIAGAAAILAAIAFVVFAAIEMIDASAREPRLNMALLGLLLAGAVGYWGCGRVANMLHRSVYNRDHPKFAD